jgi:hypothetical protein
MQHHIRSSQHFAEQIQFAAENIKGQLLCFVVRRQKVNHGNIVLLAVPVAPANPLLDPLRIPWQVVIYNRVAKLQIQPLCARLGRYEDSRTCLEFVY